MSASATFAQVTSRPNSIRRTYVLGVTAMLALGACSSDKANGVEWGDYGQTLQSSIDALATAKNCTGLQEQFDTADANNASTKARTGHNNAELLKYIDGKLKSAGCY